MFPTELDDYPTLSSSISFHSNLRIHYVDMTTPHKQEQEHRLSTAIPLTAFKCGLLT